MKKSTLLFSIFRVAAEQLELYIPRRARSKYKTDEMIFFCRGTCYYYIQAVSFDGGNLSSSYSCAFLRDLSHSLSLLTYSSVLLWAAWVLVVVSLCNVSWLPVDDVSIRWRRNRSTDNRHSAYRPHSSAAILLLIILKAFISFRKHPFQNDGTVRAANARMECHSYWEV